MVHPTAQSKPRQSGRRRGDLASAIAPIPTESWLNPEKSVAAADDERTNRESAPSQGERDRHNLIAIAQRAYQIAERRGFAPGREVDDWLQAEREFGGNGASRYEGQSSD